MNTKKVSVAPPCTLSNMALELADAKRTLPPREIARLEKEGLDIVEKPERSPLLMDMEDIDYLIWVFTHVREYSASSF